MSKKYTFSLRRPWKGIAISILLSISSLGLALSSSIVSVHIYSSSSYTRVTLESNFSLKYRQFFLSSPDRVVVDLENVQLNGVLQGIGKRISSRDPYLKLIRVGQFNQKVVRLVFEVKTRIDLQIFSLTNVADFKHFLVIDFSPVSVLHSVEDPLLAFLEDYSKDDLVDILSVEEKKIDTLGKDRPIIIMIDPGHGGEDPGAIGKYKTQEKDIVLQIARRLKTLINREPEMKVYMTRNEDVFIPLKLRVEKTKKIQADLFISIHADAFMNREAKGSSVFVLSTTGANNNVSCYLSETRNEAHLIAGISRTGDKYFDRTMFDLVQTATINDSLKFGAEVLKRISDVNILHKEIVDQAGFAVLKVVDIPAILVEIAFISNIEEEEKLKTQKFQQQMAESIFLGIKSYFKNGGRLSLR